MRVRCVRGFNDKKSGGRREEGDVFTVSAERFAEINSTKWGTLVEEVPQGKPSRRKPARKKAAEPEGEAE